MRLLAWTRERFWLLPTACAVLAAGLGVGLPELDELLLRSRGLPFLFGGGPEGARALLSAIISSMISFTALVFSITIVVLQLTSSQFSPRVLRTFLRDRFNQLTLGVFVATFAPHGPVHPRRDDHRGDRSRDPGCPRPPVPHRPRLRPRGDDRGGRFDAADGRRPSGPG